MSLEADQPKPASTVVLVRDSLETPQKLEVLMVRRSAGMAFGASAWVFPGGKVAAADADPAWDDLSDGTYEHYQRSLRIAAAREVFEESGLILATRDGRELDAAACAGFAGHGPGAARPGATRRSVTPTTPGASPRAVPPA